MGLKKYMKPAVRVLSVDPRINQRGARHRLALGGGDRFEPFEEAEEAATVLETSKRRVTFGIGGEGKAEIGPEGLLEAVESPTVVTLTERDPPEGEVRPKTTRIVRDRFVVETGRLVGVSEPLGALRRFTTIMRQDGVEGFGAFARQADRRGVGLIPSALVFVDREKTSESANAVGGIPGDILEKRLRPVVEARRKVVAGQLIESADVEGTREVGPRNEVLMNADGALELTAASEEMGQRKLHLVRFRYGLGKTEENFERPVGLVIEKQPQPFE